MCIYVYTYLYPSIHPPIYTREKNVPGMRVLHVCPRDSLLLSAVFTVTALNLAMMINDALSDGSQARAREPAAGKFPPGPGGAPFRAAAAALWRRIHPRTYCGTREARRWEVNPEPSVQQGSPLGALLVIRRVLIPGSKSKCRDCYKWLLHV